MARSVVGGALVWLAAMNLGVMAADQLLDNWPQWRGPTATGFAPHGDPPTPGTRKPARTSSGRSISPAAAARRRSSGATRSSS